MGSFDGAAEVYNEARHGYPEALRDHLVRVDALKPDATVVDLGAGTGQLAILAATVAANVLAIDPEPDMVRVGKQATNHQPGIRWLMGADSDIPQLFATPIDLVLIGNAFHHMDQPRLLVDLDALLNPAGVLVVCSTSIPVWLQDTDWSAALRDRLSQELGRPVGSGGTPNHAVDRQVLNASALSNVDEWIYERTELRTGDSIIGEIVSGASGAIDPAAAERLGLALDPYLTEGRLIENIKTTALLARRPNACSASPVF